MRSPSKITAERVADGRCSDDSLTADLMDGRSILVPMAWYPRLHGATAEQRSNEKIAGGGYSIHWPDLDEDLNTEGLLGGMLAPKVT